MKSKQSRLLNWNGFPRFCGRGLTVPNKLVLISLLASALVGTSMPLLAQHVSFAYTATGTCTCEGQGSIPGSVSAYTIDPASGILAQIPGSPFPAGTNSHSVVADPSGRFLYVANHDSNDVSAYTIDASSGVLTQIAGSPFAAGAGPHAVTVDPTGRFVYVANHLSNDVSAFTVNPAGGALIPISGSPFPAGTAPHSVTVDPFGLFVYVANHDSNNVSAYTVNGNSGALTPIPGSPFAAGNGPHGVAVDPTDRFVYIANELSNNVSAFTITWRQGSLGALAPISGSPFAAGAGPHAVVVDRTAQFVYVANHDSNNVSAYSVTLFGRGQGALTSVSGSPFPAGTGPHGVTVDPTAQFLYVANHMSNSVSAYTITLWGHARGVLTPISGSPFAGLSPLAVTTTAGQHGH